MLRQTHAVTEMFMLPTGLTAVDHLKPCATIRSTLECVQEHSTDGTHHYWLASVSVLTA